MTDPQDEHKVIQDVLEGRVDAFRTLVVRYQRAVYFFVLKMLRKTEEADDVTQRTFIKAFENLKQFRGEASFKTWIIRIALNLTLTELKKNKRIYVEFNEQKTATFSSFENKENEERKTWLLKALDKLPSTQKAVVTLRICEEKSFKEIADIMDSKEGTVKVNFHYAMKQLKEWSHRKKESL